MQNFIYILGPQILLFLKIFFFFFAFLALIIPKVQQLVTYRAKNKQTVSDVHACSLYEDSENPLQHLKPFDQLLYGISEHSFTATSNNKKKMNISEIIFTQLMDEPGIKIQVKIETFGRWFSSLG